MQDIERRNLQRPIPEVASGYPTRSVPRESLVSLFDDVVRLYSFVCDHYDVTNLPGSILVFRDGVPQPSPLGVTASHKQLRGLIFADNESTPQPFSVTVLKGPVFGDPPILKLETKIPGHSIPTLDEFREYQDLTRLRTPWRETSISFYGQEDSTEAESTFHFLPGNLYRMNKYSQWKNVEFMTQEEYEVLRRINPKRTLWYPPQSQPQEFSMHQERKTVRPKNKAQMAFSSPASDPPRPPLRASELALAREFFPELLEI